MIKNRAYPALLMVFIYSICQSQTVTRDTALIPADQVRAWKSNAGRNLQYPAQLEKIALYTLSFFPELNGAHISLRPMDKGAPISTRPTWGSVFRRASKRKYLVLINAGKAESLFSSVYFRASIPAQIGILGHEFCHISYFKKKNGLGLMGLGLGHISRSYMDRFEFYTDSSAIAHGLGYYLLEWATMFDKFFENYAGGQPFKNASTPTGERYMSAATVRAYINKHPQVYHSR